MFNSDLKTKLFCMTLVLAGGVMGQGATPVPYIFRTGDPIRASEVNANFAALRNTLQKMPNAPLSHFFQTDGNFAPEPTQMAEGADCTVGDVWLSAAHFISTHTLPANGQTLDVESNPGLYMVVGTKYGGDGRTTFALPDLRPVTPKSADGQALTYVICTEGSLVNGPF